jgi:membrane protein DedA with SNARE-associated domain
VPWLARALGAAGIFKYPLLFAGTVVEGPLITIACGFLYHTGVFSLLPLFLALSLGDLGGDAIWYWVGRRFAGPALSRHGTFLGLTPERFERLRGYFRRHHSPILFVSKLTMGLGVAQGTLMAAGASHVPFRAYLLWNAIGEAIYVAILLAIGYSFGQAFVAIEQGLRTGFLISGAVVILAVLYLASRFVKAYFEKKI